MTTMKAIRIHEYGAASVLRYEDAPRPEARAGEVLVRVSAAAVNPVDWKFRAGYLKEMMPLSMPWTPGLDFSGVVESVGQGVTGFRAGEAVFGKSNFPGGGSYAEFVTTPATDVVRKPSSIDHVKAAALPGPALTAWQALFASGSLEIAAGQTILILGAAGGVGGIAVQLAKSKGARVVAADRTGREAHLRALGADVVIDTGKQDLSSAGQVDAILDLVGGELQERAWQQLKRGGAFASTMSAPSADEAGTRGARTAFLFTQMNANQLQEIAALVDKGAIKMVVAKTLPLERAREAHELVEAGSAGKLVLTVR